jgi:hypothetical protein
MQRTYESKRLYATIKKVSHTPSQVISCNTHYDDGIYYSFNGKKGTKTRRDLRALVPLISSSSSSSGVVGYTKDYASSTLKEEIARIIGRQAYDFWKMHGGTWIEYCEIHIPTLILAESAYTFLYRACFPDRRKLPGKVGKDGQKGIDHTAFLQSIRRNLNPKEWLDELHQLFDSGRRDETKILLVLLGIDDMVSPATVALITNKFMYQVGVEDEECILRNILKWALSPDSNLSVLLLAGQDFTDQDMYRLMSS